MKIVYIAAAGCVPQPAIAHVLDGAVRDCRDASPDLASFVFSPQLVTKDMTEYESEEQDRHVGEMMSLIRKLDEIWLIGPDEPDEEFDRHFRMEIRVANHDGKTFRRFRTKASQTA